MSAAAGRAYCRRMTYPAPVPSRLTRDSRNKMIAGVCAGIARRYGISTGGLRLAFVVSCVLPGPQFIAYLVLWVLMPRDDRY
ncbi:phage shock protein C (PspC) family protein [Geodermatophilus amargosae]|jgi:phage shock protein PspC (stress-responsive transcriptional regulator)|uniref:Phage shock protein C (PspC) family protein n=2 Tax=Geodermatophilus TaxID=1860 RepID=A0A1I6Y907_9ACTN|nr:phage shock protein C (PspC) family protein [Geodermatophilus amargosae]